MQIVCQPIFAEDLVNEKKSGVKIADNEIVMIVTICDGIKVPNTKNDPYSEKWPRVVQYIVVFRQKELHGRNRFKRREKALRHERSNLT